ncbi:Autophagy-like protein 27 [Tolypocladium ophioglossoides CBS 100239]|uniref:Autophagy-related protein 27 n=1 Tax=Tolypocladium ophioglossoides (strain CBS 100239) TaxID=1163406 RepID=A0A0L0NJF9_TOLOC|nr:Autophagy-like protein 27 [Tolypocladium ophioglossoides CBS 100239]
MYPPQLSAFALSMLLAPLPSWAMLYCENIRIDDHSFDLSKLGGPHSVVTSRYESIPDAHHNTTYTLDICKPLKKSGKGKKTEECPNGTRVCAITRLLKGDTHTIDEVVAIAGSLENVGGSQFEYEVTRLKTSDSNSDSQKEGLRLVLKGGKHPLDGPVKDRSEQRAIVEFLCDPEKKGDEGEWEAEDKYEKDTKLRRRTEDKGDDNKGGEDGGDDGKENSSTEHQLKKKGAALVWESYQKEKDADVLRLTWHTKYACEKRDPNDGEGEGDGNASSHWGFFTWFVIIVFLGIAAYLIFGSWLNYNRYGARGWDLLPHGDTIRDIPYLLKDWMRRVLNTVQGTGSRGGYSAV